MKPTTNELMAGLMERTDNPVAPIIMQNLATAINSAGVLFDCTNEAVMACQERLLKDFPDNPELNQLSSSPEFITALLIMLKTSIIRFTAESVRQPRKLSTGNKPTTQQPTQETTNETSPAPSS